MYYNLLKCIINMHNLKHFYIKIIIIFYFYRNYNHFGTLHVDRRYSAETFRIDDVFLRKILNFSLD